MGILDRITHSLNRLTNSAGVRVYLNHTYGRYGQMLELKIDDQAKTIEATVQLKGEAEPIRLHMGGYTLNAEANTITVGEVQVSREWMNVLANELVKGKAWPMPEGMGKWAKLVL